MGIYLNLDGQFGRDKEEWLLMYGQLLKPETKLSYDLCTDTHILVILMQNPRFSAALLVDCQAEFDRTHREMQRDSRKRTCFLIEREKVLPHVDEEYRPYITKRR